MHKGPLYELWQEFRTWCGEYPYPHWAPKSWTISIATWSGTASGLVPPAPLYLVAVGVTPSLECLYECPLFDSGGGVYAVLQFRAYLISETVAEGMVGGDWGTAGQLPTATNYRVPQPFSPLSKFFSSTGSAPEAYLRPTRLVWEPTSY